MRRPKREGIRRRERASDRENEENERELSNITDLVTADVGWGLSEESIGAGSEFQSIHIFHCIDNKRW